MRRSCAAKAAHDITATGRHVAFAIHLQAGQPDSRPPAPVAPVVARLEDARHRQPPPRPQAEPAEHTDTSHLPAFLLRPIRRKA